MRHVDRLAGLDDDPSTLTTTHPLVRRLHRQHPGWRMAGAPSLTAAAVAAVCGQRVTARQGHRSWAGIVRTLGEPAPGPAGLHLPPTPSHLADLGDARAHRLGIERRRATTIRAVGRCGDRLDADPRRGRARLATLPGVGPWTLSILDQQVLADPDAVIVGDLHLPGLVAWALAQERHADDGRMLELLEPFRGHRGRVVRLLGAAGLHPPRRRPRGAVLDLSRC